MYDPKHLLGLGTVNKHLLNKHKLMSHFQEVCLFPQHKYPLAGTDQENNRKEL